MIKDDRIYQVLLKYNFDLFRGDKNITEYMREHCNQFYCDICDAEVNDEVTKTAIENLAKNMDVF